MAGYTFNDGGDMRMPKPFDERTGFWDNNADAWALYESRADALTALRYRYVSQTVPVLENGQQVDYWFVGGILDPNFVRKDALPDTTITINGTAGNVDVDGGTQNLANDMEWTVNLVPTAVTPGEWTKVTVDQFGRATSGDNIDSGDVTTALGYTPADETTTLTAGNGITGGGDISDDRTFTLGNPSSITLTSNNAVTATSHSHEFAPGGSTAQYIRGDGSLATFPSIPAGTVTSVGMSVPSALLSVSGSPITSSGSFSVSLPVRSANSVFAGPASGSNASPTFRALVSDDIPNLGAAKITSGTFTVARIPNLNANKITAGVLDTARLGSGTASSSTYLRGDNTWAAVPDTGITSITIGNGLIGSSPITSTGTITMGTPGTLNGSTTNAVTASSHTHTINLTAGDVGAVPTSRQVIAGDHLNGGGALSSNVTVNFRPTAAAYIFDSENSPRMVFGSTGASEYNNFVFRLSLANGRYQFMDSAGNPILFVGPGGTISYAYEEVTGTSVSMTGAPLKLMSDVTVDTEYDLVDREEGQNIQLFVKNAGTEPIDITIFGARLVGNTEVGPGKEAVVSVQNTQFPGRGTYYTVLPEPSVI